MYLIDGHNLIGQLPDISLDDPHDEAKLVQKLLGFAARTSKKIVVVFDRGIPAGRSQLGNAVVEVIFANPIGTADDVIIGRINKARNPQQWVVVSGDANVRAAAQRRKMRVITSAEFAPQLKIAPPVSKHDPVERHPKALDVRVSASEVEYWLNEFASKPAKPPKPPTSTP